MIKFPGRNSSENPMIYYINIIMFLNIQKIGKTKHKYKSKITFVKLIN